MASPRNIALRSFGSGDRDGVLALFEHTFQTRRTAEEWEWRFRHNPPTLAGATPDVCAELATDSDAGGRIVGHYGVTPTFVNHAGTKVLACQSGDTMVGADYQGLGLFLRLAQESYRALEAQGFKMVFGFPNKNSFPGFIRRLAWQPVFRLTQYSLRLRVGGIPTPQAFSPKRLVAQLRNQRRIRAMNLEVAESSKLPEDYDSLWLHVAPHHVLSIWKDREYLSWRYEKNSFVACRFIALRSHGQLVGLGVATRLDGTLTISDLQVYQKSVEIGQSLVAEMVRLAQRDGATKVIFSGGDDGFWAAIFEGFHPTLTELQFAARVFSGGMLEARSLLPHNWSVTSGDLDVW